ncbi:MAG: hypothetical protein F6K31_03005 [Symploca sp. SIO2G7]|nr:hypothetical protein [Symploca sp. SIO2G7]
MANVPRKPETLEKLEQWVSSRQDHGKINGEPAFKSGTTEFRYGMVPGDIYDLALLKGAPLSFSKSDIGTYALTRFASSPLIQIAEEYKLLVPGEFEGKTEFRASIPNGLYELVQQKKELLGYSNSQVMTIALALFIYDPGITALYDEYVKGLAEKHSISVEEVQQKIFDLRRYQARVKRLELSRKKGEFVSDRKLS